MMRPYPPSGKFDIGKKIFNYRLTRRARQVSTTDRAEILCGSLSSQKTIMPKKSRSDMHAFKKQNFFLPRGEVFTLKFALTARSERSVSKRLKCGLERSTSSVQFLLKFFLFFNYHRDLKGKRSF